MVRLSAVTAFAGASAPIAAPAGPHRSPDASNVRGFGAVGDGRVDDTAAFLAAAAAGAPLFVPAGRYTLTRDIAFQARVSFADGAMLNAGHGVALAFGGGLSAEAHAIFDLAPDARVNLDARFTTTGHPEWWGARTNVPTFDCQPAIQACVRACPRTLLQAADYYIATTVKITDHGHSLEGVSADQNGNRGGSRLMLTSGTADGLQIGYDRPPANAKLWLEHVKVRDLTVLRTARIANPVAGFAGAPAGVRLQWAVSCDLERVETMEHSHGFFIAGTVHCFLRYCQALRFTPGATRTNDFFNGFFMDNSAPTQFNSGNASLYFQNCSTFSSQAIGLSESNGLKSNAGFTDTFIHGFECAGVGYGLNMNGRTTEGADYQAEDLIIGGCVIDSPTVVGISIATGTETSTAQIHNCYVAPAGAGVGIRVRAVKGFVGVTGCQVISTPGNTATGLEVREARGVSAMNNVYTDIHRPVVIIDSTDCRVLDSVNNVTHKTRAGAVQVTGLQGGYLAPAIFGAAGAHAIGVALVGPANGHIEINCTGIRSSCIAGGAAGVLVCDGRPITRAGPISGNNLASGIIG